MRRLYPRDEGGWRLCEGENGGGSGERSGERHGRDGREPEARGGGGGVGCCRAWLCRGRESETGRPAQWHLGGGRGREGGSLSPSLPPSLLPSFPAPLLLLLSLSLFGQLALPSSRPVSSLPNTLYSLPHGSWRLATLYAAGGCLARCMGRP
jgi:hypothetical protein